MVLVTFDLAFNLPYTVVNVLGKCRQIWFIYGLFVYKINEFKITKNNFGLYLF